VSFLYVIAAHKEGPVKLGLSMDPQRRVRQLQTGSAEALFIHHVEEVSDGRVKIAEKALHQMLGHKRLKGEWFNISVEDAIAEVTHIRMTEDPSDWR
jgi:predicted GIY-YIG superfamily endonuclease